MRHRPAPQIGRGPSKFQPGTFTPMQQPILGQSQQPPPDAIIHEQLQELALEIYARLVVAHLGKHGIPAEVDYMRTMAEEARSAAKIYFESLGVQFDG